MHINHYPLLTQSFHTIKTFTESTIGRAHTITAVAAIHDTHIRLPQLIPSLMGNPLPNLAPRPYRHRAFLSLAHALSLIPAIGIFNNFFSHLIIHPYMELRSTSALRYVAILRATTSHQPPSPTPYATHFSYKLTSRCHY